MRPIIGITMGDPAGIGPEVIVKALNDPALSLSFFPVLLGNTSVFNNITDKLKAGLRFTSYREFNEIDFTAEGIAVLDNYALPLSYKPGSIGKSSGDHSYQAVVQAVQLALAKKIDAIVTAPINKEAWHLAGHQFDGHTGLLSHLTGSTESRMMFASAYFHVTLVTTHLPLKKVSSLLSIERVYQTITLSHEHLRQLGISHPRIAVCGLNPHAGENGLFGNEDRDLILPAIKRANREQIDASGPFPADTIFLAARSGQFDLVIAQYHDQGLIPIKLLAFDSAVNVTIGLPLIRTSVDHGTAFDIAEKGIANHTNMVEAIRYACKLIEI